MFSLLGEIKAHKDIASNGPEQENGIGEGQKPLGLEFPKEDYALLWE